MSNINNDFNQLLHELDVWSCSRYKTEFDWAESFPHIVELVDAACGAAMCSQPNRSIQRDFENIARVVSMTDESERAIEKIIESGVSLQNLKMIAAAGDWKCRWQIYAYIDCSNELAEQVVYLGTWDLHPYVARRAFMNLMTSTSKELLAEATCRLSFHDDKKLSDIAKKYND